MKNEIQIFEHAEFGELRVINSNGDLWFIAKDIAKILGYYETANMTKRLDVDEKGKIESSVLDDSSDSNDLTIISESGFYNAVICSKKPEAKLFKKWVTSKVLPSIRKTGGYIAGQETLSDEQLLAKALGVANRILAERDLSLKNALQEKAQVLVQNEDLKMQIGNSTDWKSVKALKWLKDLFNLKDKGAYISIGSQLTKISNQMGYNVYKIEDDKWGTVNVYHTDVIAVFKNKLMSDLNMMKKYRSR